jgi:hypothetical protein
MTKFLVTFGDDVFAQTRERLRGEAVASGMFDRVVAFGPTDLASDFRARHGRFMSLNPRGYGFWIWKPHVVELAFAQAAENDLIVYADAGCAINSSAAARLNYYIERVTAHPSGVLGFELTGQPARHFTKMDIFEAMNARAYLPDAMHMATVIVFRKCAAASALLADWNRWCANYRLISDQPSNSANDPGFQRNLGDQSIFSVLCKFHRVDSIPDETYGDNAASPILVKRLRPKLTLGTKLKRSLLKRRAAIAGRLGFTW